MYLTPLYLSNLGIQFVVIHLYDPNTKRLEDIKDSIVAFKMLPLFVSRIFKITARTSVVESLFSKVTETSAFCNAVDKSSTCMVCFQK